MPKLLPLSSMSLSILAVGMLTMPSCCMFLGAWYESNAVVVPTLLKKDPAHQRPVVTCHTY